MNARTLKCLMLPLCLAAALCAGCLDFGSSPVDAQVPDDAGDTAAEDAAPEAAPEDQPGEGAADPDVPEAADPQPGDAPDAADEHGEIVICPPDNPTDGHVYINVRGRVESSEPVAPGTQIYLGAFDPVDMLMTPGPVPIAEGVAENDLTFAFDCLDVGGDAFGLVILSDDFSTGGPDGTAGDLYPAATLAASWGSGVDPQDVEDAMAVAMRTSSIPLLEMVIPDLDVDNSGLLMGVVMDGTTGDPIAGAVVECSDSARTIYYLDDSGMGFTTNGGTSSLGVYLVPGPLALGYVTASAESWSFPQRMAATMGSLVVFIPIEGLHAGP